MDTKGELYETFKYINLNRDTNNFNCDWTHSTFIKDSDL